MAEEWTTKRVDRFVIVNKVIGQGTYGTVYRGFLQTDENVQLAVKVLSMKAIKDSAKMQELIKREIGILNKIQHPHIVQLYHVSRTSQNLYMFLEFCNDGDLRNYLLKKNDGRLSELEAVIFFKHIVEGFKAIYQIKVIHRDIKPANILLHNGRAKISDFGFARIIDTEMDGDTNHLLYFFLDPSYFSRVGTPLYMAPQILEGQPFSAKCDIWSFGIMFFQILYGRTPWDGDNQYRLLENIKKNPLTFPSYPVRSQTIKNLIKKMLEVDEKDRINWESLFEHEVVKMKEAKIRQNMEKLLKDRDSVVNSASLNQAYIESNLVIGYLADTNSASESKLQLQSETLMEKKQQPSSDIDNIGEKEKDIVKAYSIEKKKRDQVLKLRQYFLYERNIAFFFNYLIQKAITLIGKKVLTFQEDICFKLIFCISKNQLIQLTKVMEQIKSENQQQFDAEIWKIFRSNPEHKKIIDILNQDINHCFIFFTEILKKTKMVLDQYKDESYQSIFDTKFEISEQFFSIYKKTIRDFIERLKQYLNTLAIKNDDNYKSLIQFLYFLHICVNPYVVFENVQVDFNRFYEESENKSIEDFIKDLEKFNKKKG